MLAESICSRSYGMVGQPPLESVHLTTKQCGPLIELCCYLEKLPELHHGFSFPLNQKGSITLMADLQVQTKAWRIGFRSENVA